MQPLARLAAASLVAFALALSGCSSPSEPSDDDAAQDLAADSFHMTMTGVPAAPVLPGARFNVTVQGTAMHGMHGSSDHMGAHFWNRTVADPSASLGNATACAHTMGDMPGTFTATCTAPMQPGTYHLYGHMRMTDMHSTMHHYWSAEQSFTVA